MSLNSHDWVYITVTKDCIWCWKDDTGCFPAGKLPGQGKIEAGHYGPFIPTKKGQVDFYSVMSGPCPPATKGKTVARALSTPHSIIVGA
jgi:hypothetical protein